VGYLLLRFGPGEEFASGLLHIAADSAESVGRRVRGRGLVSLLLG